MLASIGGRRIAGRAGSVWAPARPCCATRTLAPVLALALLGPSPVPPTASAAALPGAPAPTSAGNRVDGLQAGRQSALSPDPSPTPPPSLGEGSPARRRRRARHGTSTGRAAATRTPARRRRRRARRSARRS